MTNTTPQNRNWRSKIVGTLQRAFALFLWEQGLAGAPSRHASPADALLMLIGIAGAIACFRFAANSAFERSPTRLRVCWSFFCRLLLPAGFVALCALALDTANPYLGPIHLACGFLFTAVAALIYAPVFGWRLYRFTGVTG